MEHGNYSAPPLAQPEALYSLQLLCAQIGSAASSSTVKNRLQELNHGAHSGGGLYTALQHYQPLYICHRRPQSCRVSAQLVAAGRAGSQLSPSWACSADLATAPAFSYSTSQTHTHSPCSHQPPSYSSAARPDLPRKRFARRLKAFLSPASRLAE
ncbi:hypothetical protein BCR35DRAFT_190603 [Leucosporidium creatinivorum]|uniref:Uncharacterized protein n=1 Tax=Leucosporidium creatinivorum TaxID=106004 RepID=A0A1Y2FYA0_9BASI|nr:hypothetical protein BCR35DRAFT_190603 [Leucosporidium creatinivorum]